MAPITICSDFGPQKKKVSHCFHCFPIYLPWSEMGIPDHLTGLLRNLYAGQEATVRAAHGTTDWFQIGKGVRQGCVLSPCLFNLYAEYIMRNAGLEQAQAGIKIAWRNTISQIFRWYHFNGRKWSGSKKPLDESERGEEKAGLKFSIQKTNIIASGPITSRQIDGETTETVRDFFFGGGRGGGAPKSLQMVTAAMKLKNACSLEEKLWPS